MEAFIALGSNIGDRRDYLEQALIALNQVPTTTVARVSPIYRSPAVTLDGSAGPEFLNSVCALTTKLIPLELFRSLRIIEHELGRTRHRPWDPRTIDLDLLSYGTICTQSRWLELPHPKLHERDFVLQPLADVAPHWRHPHLGRTAGDMLERLAQSGKAGNLLACCGSFFSSPSAF